MAVKRKEPDIDSGTDYEDGAGRKKLRLKHTIKSNSSSDTMDGTSAVSANSMSSRKRTKHLQGRIHEQAYPGDWGVHHPVSVVAKYIRDVERVSIIKKWNSFKKVDPRPIKDIQTSYINHLQSLSSSGDKNSTRILNLFNFIINSKRLKKPLHVWRGDPPHVREALLGKRRFNMSNFTSTSIYDEVAYGFGTEPKTDIWDGSDDTSVFDIWLPRGFPMCLISIHEYEVLLPPFITIVVDRFVIKKLESGNTCTTVMTHPEDWEYILPFRDKVEHKKRLKEIHDLHATLNKNMEVHNQDFAILKALRYAAGRRNKIKIMKTTTPYF